MRSSTLLRAVASAAVLGLLLGACGSRGGVASDGPAATAPPPPTAAPTTSAGASAEPTAPPNLSGDLSIWTYPQGDDEKSLKAYKAAFEKLYPNVNVKISVVPEDTYGTKVNTALQAHKPPDIAVIEDRGWMKAGKVLDLTPYYASWGVNLADFNAGGLARAAVEGKVEDGVYAVGDFLGGGPLVYNKAMFDAAGIAYPSAEKSLTIQEYADICRKLAKPTNDPATTVYGCTSTSLVSLARSPRRTSSAMPPLSTHTPGSVACRRARSRSTMTRRRRRSRPTPVCCDLARSRASERGERQRRSRRSQRLDPLERAFRHTERRAVDRPARIGPEDAGS